MERNFIDLFLSLNFQGKMKAYDPSNTCYIVCISLKNIVIIQLHSYLVLFMYW